MTKTNFVLRPISDADAERLRLDGGEIYVADEHPGYPCRQCLRDADVGEELILVSHDPFDGQSAYRSASPIFLHRSPCSWDGPARELPPQLTGRQLSVRAFDGGEQMVDARVIDGTALAETIEALFSNGAAHLLHVHNATRGCWAVSVERNKNV